MATIQTTLAAGSTTSPFFVNIKVTKQLCSKTSSAPVFVPVFTLLSYTNVGENQYEALVNIQGVATYTPCGSCCAKSQTVNERFLVPFSSTTAPSDVSVVGGTPVNSLVNASGCCSCSNTFTCDVPISLTVTTS